MPPSRDVLKHALRVNEILWLAASRSLLVPKERATNLAHL